MTEILLTALGVFVLTSILWFLILKEENRKW